MNADTIRLLDDIDGALRSGLGAAESLVTWQHGRGAEAYDAARAYRDNCQRGLDAFTLLRRRLGEGRLHVEPPPDVEPPTECHCATTSHPPCSVCCP